MKNLAKRALIYLSIILFLMGINITASMISTSKIAKAAGDNYALAHQELFVADYVD